MQYYCIAGVPTFAIKIMILRYYLFLFVLAFYLLAFVFRSYLLWKNTGINPLTFDKTDDAHGFNGKLFKLISILGLVVIIIYSFGGEWSTYLLPFWYLEKDLIQIVGLIIMHLAFIWILIAQLQMSNSWRIGIDYENRTNLIVNGLFSISRNPIFLGVLFVDLGLFLTVPNAFTLLILVWSYTVIQTQVRLEEAFLVESHGSIYKHYYKTVKRWF